MKKIGITKGLFHILVLVTVLLMATQTAQADPHAGQSKNVSIIGSPVVAKGGIFPTSGAPGELGDFTFTNLAPGDVNSANLAAFDTVLLNVASSQMGCKVNTLTDAAKADLVSFVNNSGKLIIYESECSGQNYSWLPYSFTTNNPGRFGNQGTLTITEENILSTSTLGEHYIDYIGLVSSTDAVGDMNVMTTLDSNWCLDMSGTNANIVAGPGPVHTYAKYGKGLIIYNGMDLDYLGSPWDIDNGLKKIWVQELQAASALLPCGIKVVGITLTPASATNIAGQTHTVTAKLTDLLNNPQSGLPVTFSVVSGPNTAASGTCSPGNCTSNTTGEVSFTYTGIGGVGQDKIKACFDKAGVQKCDEATKDWNPSLNSPPAAEAGGPYTVDEGSPVTLSGSGSTDLDRDVLTYAWDLNNDGTYETPGETATITPPDGPKTLTVGLQVSDGKGGTSTDTATVTVNNVAPTVTVSPSFSASVPITLRIAGQGKVGNSVALDIIQNGVVIASGKITRTPGSPNEQEVTLSTTIDLSKPYSGRLVFDTEDALSGGTPVWLRTNGNLTKVTTFNTQKSKPKSYHQTYEFNLVGIVSLVGAEITFSGTATDPGTDDLTFDWAFGDSGTASKLYPWSGSHTVTDTVKHTYSVAGSYTVSLNVADGDGGVGSDTKTIVIS